ncbi:MAG: rhodanese-like domain-containing protein, partial [Bacteroidota bacterium]|nr:rhodanese-like domain-containing protein [Bacteroidota bacterium]
PADEIVVCCQSGQRGARVLEILSERFPTKKFYNLAGGIQSWLSYRQKN